MKPIKLTLTFKKDGIMVARIIVVVSLLLAGAFITFAMAFVLTTLNAAFDTPAKVSDAATEEQAYLAPELISRVLTAQEQRLAPDEPLPADLRDPFAPRVIAPTPAPEAPAETATEAPPTP